MGKVKATEIVRGKTEYVSLVGRGANGKELEIFKSADYKRDTNKEELSNEEKSLFKKLFKFIKREEDDMGDIMNADKMLAGIEGLSEAVKGLTSKVEEMDKKIIEVQESGKEAKTDTGQATGQDGAGGGTQEKKSVETVQPADKSGQDNEVLDKMSKSLEEITNSVKELSGRVDKMEAIRRDSNVLPGSFGKEVKSGDRDTTYDNIFINTSALEVQ
jgi:archaellum component FlaC